jgi:hypothetical protein
MEKMQQGHKIGAQIHTKLYKHARLTAPAHAVEATRRANAN